MRAPSDSERSRAVLAAVLDVLDNCSAAALPAGRDKKWRPRASCW